MFKNGRTETGRPVTSEIVNCIEGYKNLLENSDDEELLEKINEQLRAAMKTHNQNIKRCLSGYGIDAVFYRTDPLLYHKIGNMVIFRSANFVAQKISYFFLFFHRKR